MRQLFNVNHFLFVINELILHYSTCTFLISKAAIKKTHDGKTQINLYFNTLYFNLSLHKNPSDLTLPQITWQSPSFQSTPCLSKNIFWYLEPIIISIVN